MTNALYVKLEPAGETIAKLVAIAQAAFENETMHIEVTTNVGGLSFNINNVPASGLATHQHIQAFHARCDDRRHVTCARAAFRQQANTPNSFGLVYEAREGVFATLTIERAPDQGRAFSLLEAIETHFGIIPYADLLQARAPATERAALQMHERAVAELGVAVDKLLATEARLIESDAITRKKLLADLEAEFRQRQSDLLREHAERGTALDERKRNDDEALGRKSVAFDERVKQFETRESKFVRRDLLGKIQSHLDSLGTFSVSDGTKNKRGAIHALAFTLLAFALGAVVFDAVMLKDLPPAWRFGAMCAASITFVTTMVYYLKWNDRWFREHADGEFAAKRYKADILRASWIAELVAELANESGKSQPLPPELLDAFTRNLFRDVGGRSEVSEHPLDNLTGLVKRATEVSVGKAGFRVRATGKGDGGESA